MRKYLRVVDNNRATKWQRFAEYILDRIFIQVIFYGTIFIFGILNATLFNENIDESFEEENTSMDFVFILIYLTYIFSYYCLMEYYLGRTLAKYITGTKVISIDGEKPTFMQILGRTFSRIVPFDALSFLGENGWHDSWSDTRVIDIKKYTTETQMKREIENIGVKEIA
jgi:uncharacterized RDD family membrane protein YckC